MQFTYDLALLILTAIAASAAAVASGVTVYTWRSRRHNLRCLTCGSKHTRRIAPGGDPKTAEERRDTEGWCYICREKTKCSGKKRI